MCFISVACFTSPYVFAEPLTADENACAKIHEFNDDEAKAFASGDTAYPIANQFFMNQQASIKTAQVLYTKTSALGDYLSKMDEILKSLGGYLQSKSATKKPEQMAYGLVFQSVRDTIKHYATPLLIAQAAILERCEACDFGILAAAESSGSKEQISSGCSLCLSNILYKNYVFKKVCQEDPLAAKLRKIQNVTVTTDCKAGEKVEFYQKFKEDLKKSATSVFTPIEKAVCAQNGSPPPRGETKPPPSRKVP